tara:strand:+ start:1933 stop:2418 length:486 start_codon:yes stop_codon:yes gene_type:complete
MPYTVTFLDDKLYQSLSFDADIKFPKASFYAKKIWCLKEYKKQGQLVELSELSEGEKKEKPPLSSPSYSINKHFENDELVVELVQSFAVSDDFDFFTKAELEKETGDEELDEILLKINQSDFDESVIKAFILDSLLQGEYPQKPEDSEASEEQTEEESDTE